MPGVPEGVLVPLGLIALFVMSFFGASPVPIPFPLTITILWLAQYKVGVWVVLSATAGTLAGWACLEKVFRRWVQAPKLKKAIPVAYQRFFLKRTGWWLFFFNALPFPWDHMRFLALLNDYPRGRLLLVLGASRLIRSTILVTVGTLLAPYKVLFWAVLIAFMVIPLLMERLMQWIFARFRPEEVLPSPQPGIGLKGADETTSPQDHAHTPSPR